MSLLPVGPGAFGQGAETAQPDTVEPNASEPRRPRRLQDSINTDQEWVPGQGGDQQKRLERKLSLAARAIEAGNLTAPVNSNALDYYRDALEIDPDNATALTGINDVVNLLIIRARGQNQAGDRRGAEDLLRIVRTIDPDSAALAAAERDISQRAEIDAGLQQGQAAITAGDLAQALASFNAVKAIEDSNIDANAGIAVVVDTWLARANTAIEAEDFELAEQHLGQAEAIDPESAAESRALIASLRNQAQLAVLLTAAEQALTAGDLDAATRQLQAYKEAGGERFGDLEQELNRQRRLAQYPPGSEFRDAELAPMMVVVPSGRFQMGSPSSEEGRYSNEGPQQDIRLGTPFALGKYEVTVGEFRQFVDATGFQTDAERTGESSIYDLDAGQLTKRAGMSWRNDFAGDVADNGLPVIHVSRNDAQAYAEWLAQQTSESYRLPSEAEFEYALRAGSSTPYWWGLAGRPESNIENLAGENDSEGEWSWREQGFAGYRDGSWGPAPVGSFEPNPFGLMDMGGNVLEWVDDCYDRTLAGISNDGSPRGNRSCERYVLKGGSWANPPRRSRSAQRTPGRAAQTTCLVGFRVARAL